MSFRFASLMIRRFNSSLAFRCAIPIGTPVIVYPRLATLDTADCLVIDNFHSTQFCNIVLTPEKQCLKEWQHSFLLLRIQPTFLAFIDNEIAHFTQMTKF